MRHSWQHLSLLLASDAVLAQRVLQGSVQHFQSDNAGAWQPLLALGFGTPPQEITGIFDSGSADTIVPQAGSQLCKVKNQQCAPPAQTVRGQFDPKQASDVQALRGDKFNASFSGGDNFDGEYIKTTVSVSGGKGQVSNAQVALASGGQPAGDFPQFAIFGFSPREGEATDKKYDNLPQVMKDGGVTKGNSYSVVLNPTPFANGSVFFGGIDRSKFDGELQQVAIDRTTDGKIADFVVKMTSMAMDMSGGNQEAKPSKDQQRARMRLKRSLGRRMNRDRVQSKATGTYGHKSVRSADEEEEEDDDRGNGSGRDSENGRNGQDGENGKNGQNGMNGNNGNGGKGGNNGNGRDGQNGMNGNNGQGGKGGKGGNNGENGMNGGNGNNGKGGKGGNNGENGRGGNNGNNGNNGSCGNNGKGNGNGNENGGQENGDRGQGNGNKNGNNGNGKGNKNGDNGNGKGNKNGDNGKNGAAPSNSTSGNVIDLGLTKDEVFTLFDTGGVGLQLPVHVVRTMAKALGADFDEQRGGIGPVECGKLNAGNKLVLGFNDDKVKMTLGLDKVRVSEELTDPELTRAGMCNMGVDLVQQGDNLNSMGFVWFTDVYTVFDLENNSLWFAQAKGDPSAPAGKLEEFP